MEFAIAWQWISDTLKAWTPLTALVGTRIYAERAPEDAAYPLVLYRNATPNRDGKGVGRVSLWTFVHVRIHAVTDQRTAAPCVPIAQEIMAALDHQTGINEFGLVFSCDRVTGSPGHLYQVDREYPTAEQTFVLQVQPT